MKRNPIVAFLLNGPSRTMLGIAVILGGVALVSAFTFGVAGAVYFGALALISLAIGEWRAAHERRAKSDTKNAE